MGYLFLFSLAGAGLIQTAYVTKLCKIKFFRKRESVECIKKSCIHELHSHKVNTPTMGGIAIGLSFLISTVVYYFVSGTMLWMNLFLLLFSAMGFIDDYIKLKKIRDGITPLEKLLGSIILAFVIVLYLYLSGQTEGTRILIPFLDEGMQVEPVFYIIFSIFVIVASSNSMNITDGLDGLALGISIMVYGFIGIIAWQREVYDVLFGVVTLGAACIATLYFNRYPARVFMGDTGSLFLGASIAVFLIRLRMHLWIIMLLAVCIWETISVIIQIWYLKFFHRKVFLIAPFHHHLEKRGWKETKIVFVFWGITLVCCIIAYLGVINI